MKSQLKRKLHQFLEVERISLESGIVNEITYRLAGIEVKKEYLSSGFSFDRWSNGGDKEKIKFTIPTGFSLVQLHQILNLFKIAPEQYQVDTPLTLDDQYALEQFVPQFEQYFLQMKEAEPTSISQYKITSAPILESSAKETLKKYIADVNNILLSENLKELTDTWKSLVEFIILLSGRMQSIEKFPLFYKDILKSVEGINAFLLMPEISENITLTSKLNMIREGIELYARYHRNESVLALIAFQKELKSFLKDYKVCTEAEGCDILEHVVLNLADAKQYSSLGSCKFSVGSDPSRLIITYKDMDKENTQKVIDYMRSLGDETACEGYGSRHYGSYIEESATMEKSMLSYSSNIKKKKTESHTIEMDGKFFYETVFPKIKAKIDQMAIEKQLEKYQELSKEFFPLQSTKQRISPVSMFQEPNSVTVQEVNEELTQSMMDSSHMF